MKDPRRYECGSADAYENLVADLRAEIATLKKPPKSMDVAQRTDLLKAIETADGAFLVTFQNDGTYQSMYRNLNAAEMALAAALADQHTAVMLEED